MPCENVAVFTSLNLALLKPYVQWLGCLEEAAGVNKGVKKKRLKRTLHYIIARGKEI